MILLGLSLKKGPSGSGSFTPIFSLSWRGKLFLEGEPSLLEAAGRMRMRLTLFFFSVEEVACGIWVESRILFQ
jgi:hypothetical protein